MSRRNTIVVVALALGLIVRGAVAQEWERGAPPPAPPGGYYY